LEVGSDADLVLIDLKREKKNCSRKSAQQAEDQSIQWVGSEGSPNVNMVRGNIVAEEGEIVGKPGYGVLSKPLSQTRSRLLKNLHQRLLI